jgi:hypothetical protein
VLSGLDVVRIEVETQKVLQGQCVAKKNTGMCVDLGLGGSAKARRLGVQRQPDHRERLCHVVESEEMIKGIRPKTRGQ